MAFKGDAAISTALLTRFKVTHVVTRATYIRAITTLAATPWIVLHMNDVQRKSAMIVCVIRYQIDPFQLSEFAEYAATWSRIIPRCGGHLIGYFVPHEGTNDIAWGLIGFDTLASYERYKGQLRADKEAIGNFQFAQSRRFILREERSFVRLVDNTFNIAPVAN